MAEQRSATTKGRAKRGTTTRTFVQRTKGGYQATETLERELETHGQVSLDGGPYRLAVVRSTLTYEAWTESQPFLYGRILPTLQDAFDDVHRKFEDWKREHDSQCT
jgi:hypothetical protein